MVQIEEADFNSNKILNSAGRTVKYGTLNLIDICVKLKLTYVKLKLTYFNLACRAGVILARECSVIL